MWRVYLHVQLAMMGMHYMPYVVYASCGLPAQYQGLHLMDALSCCSTYQPRWDSWGRLAQQSTAYVPWNTIAGKNSAQHASAFHDDHAYWVRRLPCAGAALRGGGT